MDSFLTGCKITKKIWIFKFFHRISGKVRKISTKYFAVSVNIANFAGRVSALLKAHQWV